MKKLQVDAILVSLIESLMDNGSWCGETHIQKATYFLQEVLEVPLEFDFMLYKHGPFSFDLRDEITSMRADRLLRLTPQPPYGPSLYPDEGAASIKNRFPKTLVKYKDRVDFIAQKLGNKNVGDLERLGTALYVRLKSQIDHEPGKVATMVHDLKPHVERKDALEATLEVDVIREEAQQLSG